MSQSADSRPRRRAPARYAGVHLSGANASKTSLVVLMSAGDAPKTTAPFPIQIVEVYEKIGSFGSLFSDERLIEILTHGGPFAEVFTDCPLTVPPCVACLRPSCPGAVKCDDVSVAYMLKVSSRLRRRGARKARPINPQSQRLWDVLELAKEQAMRAEPSYSANLAPLVARARTLQRRLNALDAGLQLKETAVAATLKVLAASLGLEAATCLGYRSFETGLASRQSIVGAMEAAGWITEATSQEQGPSVAATVETFQAFIAALVGVLHGAGLTDDQPDGFVPDAGWVHLPRLSKHQSPSGSKPGDLSS